MLSTPNSEALDQQAPHRISAQILISGTGSNAVNIASRIQNKQLLGLHITQAISNNPDAKGIHSLQALNIKTQVVNHRGFADREAFEQELANTIDQLPCDLIILAGFMRILSPEFVAKYAGKMINIHPSLLPAHKGLHTHQRALDAKDTEHGVSVHLVIPDLDAGTVIGQAVLKVHDTDTAQTLEKRVQIMEYELYPACIQLITSGIVQLETDRVSVQPSSNFALKPNATGVFTWTEDDILPQDHCS